MGFEAKGFISALYILCIKPALPAITRVRYEHMHIHEGNWIVYFGASTSNDLYSQIFDHGGAVTVIFEDERQYNGQILVRVYGLYVGNRF